MLAKVFSAVALRTACKASYSRECHGKCQSESPFGPLPFLSCLFAAKIQSMHTLCVNEIRRLLTALKYLRSPMRNLSIPKQFVGLAVSLLLTFATAAIGAKASASAGGFYRELVLPSWAPPGSVFGPVWSILYLLMGVAAWLVWRERKWSEAKAAYWLFISQLVANGLWSWLFFAWRQGAWSSIEIVLLWVLILGTVISFWRVRPLAGVLLLPYLGWVTFATALCFTIWRMNPAALG